MHGTNMKIEQYFWTYIKLSSES